MNCNKVICNNEECKETNIIYEPFNSISLSTKQEDEDIYKSLDRYFVQNDNVNTWKCEKCKKEGCRKSSNIWTLPNYVIIQLKRIGNRVNEIENSIKYPIDDLDLTKYIAKEKEDPNNYIYTLYAVNYHKGSIKGGHYWSKCKNLDDKWYEYNDDTVTIVDDRFESEIVNENANILFYYRKFIN